MEDEYEFLFNKYCEKIRGNDKTIQLIISPQVKISEEQTSSTDPEDSSGEVNQADINDVQNYENIFKPRRQELNRTPEPIDDFEYELFQPPMSGSESDNNLSRLVHYP